MHVPISHRDLMLATSASKPFSNPGWIFEPKYDGYRIIACKDGRQARLITRNGIDLASYFPEIVHDLVALPDAVIDGELVMLDDQGMPQFHRLRARIARKRRPAHRANPEVPAVFAFDLLSLRGKDMRALPLLERKAALHNLLEDIHHVRYLQHVREHGEALYRHFELLGLEGVVGKKADAPYKAGRTAVWRKVKTPAFREIEAKRLEHKRK
jgi:bifunctional non-homologous end joining protein LigD